MKQGLCKGVMFFVLFWISFSFSAFSADDAFRKLSSFRAGEHGSLQYAAKHFWEIYGEDAKKFGNLFPIFPRLGIPAFAQQGKTFHLEYLGDASALEGIQKGMKIQLVPKGLTQWTKEDKRVVFLQNLRLVKTSKIEKFIWLYRLVATVPAEVSAGFYDLVHFLPQAKKKGVTSPSSLPTSQPKLTFVQKRVIGALTVAKEDPLSKTRFRFIHLSDVHQRDKIGDRLETVVRTMNNIRPRPHFALLTGDIVEYGRLKHLWKQSVETLAKLEIPLFVVIGNHDYYRVHVGQPAQNPTLLFEEEGLQNFFRFYHPFLAFRFSYAGYNWLSIDTGSSATSRTWFKLRWVTTEGLGEEQLKDIRGFLDTPAKRGHVLFSHGTPRARTRHYVDGCSPGRHGVFLRGRTQIEKDLLASYKKNPRPILFLHGHTHWNDLYGRSVVRNECRFLRIKLKEKMMGLKPCIRKLPVQTASPLIISTQSATKHQPLYSGGVHQLGMSFGEGAGAGFGFRLLMVDGKEWKSASYKFYYRTRFLARQHFTGYLEDGSTSISKLAPCEK